VPHFERHAGWRDILKRALNYLVVALACTALILYAWPTPTILYESIVALHLFLGIVLLLLALPSLVRLVREGSATERIGWVVLLVGGAVGAVVFYTGARRHELPILYAHILASILGCAILFAALAGRRGWLGAGAIRATLRLALSLAVFAGIAGAAWWVRTVPWRRAYVIHNPEIAPANMDEEGDGPNGPFFPSSGQTATGKTVNENFFMDSDSCKRCHADIYQQWQSSMHHFSSFNNQWYRQSIVYMQATIGVQPSKWCAGCHDAALFFPGNFNTPIAPRVHTAPAQAGIGCMVCHSLTQIKSTMGNGDYTLKYPALSELVATKNPFLRRIIDFMIEENPEPHRRTFLKPFMQTQTADYCSVCHKVHLDVPVNHYRWARGFNDYDAWQASGVSGFGARSFYYPPKSQNCADCHMPAAASQDAGNVGGFVHSHRFVAANTAVPFATGDTGQLASVEKFLQAGQLRVDIFAISPDRPASPNQTNLASPQPAIETEFAVGEEAETPAPSAPVETPAPSPVSAPLNRVNPAVRADDTVRVDVVVRTLKVGHFFPGGTVDAFDCWLALKATDDKGRIIFWSGYVQDDGKGPVDPGAHFYRSLLIDSHGNPINRRNAWAARAVVYAHLIPPGAADTVHFRLHVPKDERGHLHLEAQLNYRKFSWFNTEFAFAGVLHDDKPDDFAPAYDDRRVTLDGSTADVSAQVKAIPSLPVVTIAHDAVDLTILPTDAPEPKPKTEFTKDEWQRWNDYGIGLLLQGDLKGAEIAFEEITKMAPTNADGWVNVGRVQVLEGNSAAAEQALERALAISPNLARAHYFYAKALRIEGKYDEALTHLRVVLAQYPYDRVVHDDVGRILFLERRYTEAIREFQATLSIDPEDLEANYNLMLCYTGLGQTQTAGEFEKRYLRFKADESAQTLTGPYLRTHPEDNLERQPIHEHTSTFGQAPPKKKYEAAANPGSGAN